MRVSILVVCVVAVLGCKKDNEELKKKALAIRDRAYACSNSACASQAEKDYIALTSDLHGLSDADAKFFFEEMSGQIRKRQREIESAPTAPKESAPAAKPVAQEASEKRTKGAGFSVVLPTGWETRKIDRPSILLAAAKGDVVAESSSFLVTRGPHTSEFATKEACEARGTEQAGAMKGVLKAAKLIDMPSVGPACMVHLERGKNDTTVALIPAKDAVYYAMCDIPIGTSHDDCIALLGSWQPES